MNHDDYRFESTEGIRLKLPPVLNMTLNRLDIPILRYPPSKGEGRNARKRMDEYFEQSKTIKNPNLLSERFKKEHDGHSVAFIDKLPSQSDFPIYILNRSNGRFVLYEDIDDVRVFYPIENPDLYWTKKSLGD